MIDDLIERLQAGEGTEEELREMLVQAAALIKRCKPILENLDREREHWRQVYAGQALQGLLASSHGEPGNFQALTLRAVNCADNLLGSLEDCNVD